jgi:hypothetical protein
LTSPQSTHKTEPSHEAENRFFVYFFKAFSMLSFRETVPTVVHGNVTGGLSAYDTGIRGAGTPDPAVRPSDNQRYLIRHLMVRSGISPPAPDFFKQFRVFVFCMATLPRKSLLFDKNCLIVYKVEYEVIKSYG